MRIHWTSWGRFRSRSENCHSPWLQRFDPEHGLAFLRGGKGEFFKQSVPGKGLGLVGFFTNEGPPFLTVQNQGFKVFAGFNSRNIPCSKVESYPAVPGPVHRCVCLAQHSIEVSDDEIAYLLGVEWHRDLEKGQSNLRVGMAVGLVFRGDICCPELRSLPDHGHRRSGAGSEIQSEDRG